MNKRYLLYLSGLAFVFLLCGCVVRTYPLTKERIDQDLASGNRGYVKGATAGEEQMKERKTTRTTQVLEVELHAPIKFEKMPKAKQQEKTPDEEIWGNRGYITKTEPPSQRSTIKAVVVVPSAEKYTVGKNDTLQKISKEFYGTTKKWLKIYEANKALLKGPDKIYPGQVLSIPIDSRTSARVNPKAAKKAEALEETEDNLK